MNAHQRDLRIPVLQPVLRVLRVLDLGENPLGNEGIRVIREPLMLNRSVLQLSLAQANITCEGTTIYWPCSMSFKCSTISVIVSEFTTEGDIKYSHFIKVRLPK